MRIDRQRALIDLVTLLVPVVVLSAYAGSALVGRPEGSSTDQEGLGVNDVYLVVTVGSQLVQAAAGQLLFRRVGLWTVERALVMVGIWFVAVLLIVWVPSRETFWAIYFAVVVVPLHVLTRLAVRTIVKAGTRALVNRRRLRKPPVAAESR